MFELPSFIVAAVTQGSVLDVAQSYDAVELINRAIAYAIIAAAFLSVVFIFWRFPLFYLVGRKIKSRKGFHYSLCHYWVGSDPAFRCYCWLYWPEP